MRILLCIQKVGDFMEKIIRVMAAASLCAIAFLINLTVFYRYILKSPLTWSTEMPELLLVLTVLLAAAPAIRKNMFTKVEFFVSSLPGKIQKVISYFTALLILIFLTFCTIAPEELLLKATLTRTITPALKIPMRLVYSIFRFGFIVILFFMLLSLLDTHLSKSTKKQDRI